MEETTWKCRELPRTRRCNSGPFLNFFGEFVCLFVCLSVSVKILLGFWEEKTALICIIWILSTMLFLLIYEDGWLRILSLQISYLFSHFTLKYFFVSDTLVNNARIYLLWVHIFICFIQYNTHIYKHPYTHGHDKASLSEVHRSGKVWGSECESK